MTYNATVYRYDAEGNEVSVFAADATWDGVMLRSNAVQCTGLEGTEAYDAYVRRYAFEGYTLMVTQDDGEGYRRRISRLGIPATYRSA